MEELDYKKPWSTLSDKEKQLAKDQGMADEASWDAAVKDYSDNVLARTGETQKGQAQSFKDYLDQKANAHNAGVSTYDLGTLGNTAVKTALSADMVNKGNERMDELQKNQPGFETLHSNPLLAQQLQKFALRQEQGSPLFVGNAMADNVKDLYQNERNNAAYYGGQTGIGGAMNQTAVLNKNSADRAALLSNEDIKAQAANEMGKLIGQQQREREVQSHQNQVRYLQDLENYRNKLSGAQNLQQTGRANLMDIGEALPYQTANLVQHGAPMFANKTEAPIEGATTSTAPMFLSKYNKWATTPSLPAQDPLQDEQGTVTVDPITNKPILLKGKKGVYDASPSNYKYNQTPMFVR